MRRERWLSVREAFAVMKTVMESAKYAREAEVCHMSRKSSRFPMRQSVWVAAELKSESFDAR